MTRFTDGKKNVSIRMAVWVHGGYLPDWENDFFEVGGLRYDEEREAYIVDDVNYLIEQAEDWRMGRGDYRDDYEGEPGHNPEDRWVGIEEY